MNEHERRQKLIDALSKSLSAALADGGLLVEGGWRIFRSQMVSGTATPGKLNELRTAFFAGAQHTFHAFMASLDPGGEPTEKDLERLDRLDKELSKWAHEMLAMNEPRGRA